MQLVYPNPEAKIIKVTPRIAQQLLDSSPGNRNIRKWHVAALATAMEQQAWKVTNQGIGVDNLGRLRDAHHRLLACIESGVSFPSLIVFGLDPDVYEVVDTGIARALRDRMDISKEAAEVLRLAAEYVYEARRPPLYQIRALQAAGLDKALDALTLFCGSKARYFSTANMRLAACISILAARDDKEAVSYVMEQYRALCLMDFDSMSEASKSLVRQVQNGNAKAGNKRDILARGLKVFNPENKDLSKVQVNSDYTSRTTKFIREVIFDASEEARDLFLQAEPQEVFPQNHFRAPLFDFR